MSNFIVTSTAALNSTLTKAHAGDTIMLAPGTYSNVTINSLKFASAVTITSQDPTHAAVIDELNLAYDQGLVFSNLEFSLPMGDGTSVPHGIYVNHAQDIHFRSDSIHGVLGLAPTNDQTGIGLANSTNVSLENSELQSLYTGLTMGSDNTVLVSGNNFHDIRVDGIEAMADQNATITNNDFSNFQHIGDVGAGGDHSDAIQFWTTGQTVGSANLTITNNLIVQGQGRDMQGIFIQDTAGKLPYENLTVAANLIVGGNWNGIMVDDGHGVVLSNDKVLPLTTQNQTPWIRVQNSDQVYLTHNAAGSFLLGDNNTHLGENSDGILAPAKDQGQSAITIWLSQHTNHTVSVGPVTAYALVHDVLAASAPIQAPVQAPVAAAVHLLGLSGETFMASHF